MNSAAIAERVARTTPAEDVAPWWRQPYCWLVIAGPLSAVIAGVITMTLAYRGADTLSPVYIRDHSAHADKRIANSVLPAEAVSKGAVVPTVPAQ